MCATGGPHAQRNLAFKCPICAHADFEQREYALSTRAAALFHLEWSDEPVTAFVCKHCGNMQWFATIPLVQEQPSREKIAAAYAHNR